MRYGYIRVSTKEQNEARQVIALQEYGISAQATFFDKQSDELIEANKLMLDIYKKKAKFLKMMINRK